MRTNERTEPALRAFSGTDKARDMRNLKARMRTRRASLKDCTYGHARKFPKFTPGMHTGAYIDQYLRMNRADRLHYSHDPQTPYLQFTHATGRAAPMLDPLTPEVMAEVVTC